MTSARSACRTRSSSTSGDRTPLTSWAMTRSPDHPLAHEIEAEKIGLRLWLRSGRNCASWIALRRGQKERKDGWHEPIKDVSPPFEDLIARGERGGGGR